MTNTKPGSYVVHTATFEGPLDQLLQLAQQGQVDLETIPLAEIAAEYLAHSRRAFDVEEATETLWMLAALIELKARALLPHPPPVEEPPVIWIPTSLLITPPIPRARFAMKPSLVAANGNPSASTVAL